MTIVHARKLRLAADEAAPSLAAACGERHCCSLLINVLKIM